jgi:TatD DNase family protein
MKFIDLHTHHTNESHDVFSIFNTTVTQFSEIRNQSNLPVSIGLHPWHIDKDTYQNELSLVAQYATYPNVWAIGESGLDKIISVPLQLQREVFIKHIEIAELTGKPLIIHCVKTSQQLLEIKKQVNPKVPWIIHGFRSSVELAMQLINKGLYLSFGNAIHTNQALANVFKALPLENIFLETDEFDGNIKEIYFCASELKQITVQELVEIQHSNFEKCFKVKL